MKVRQRSPATVCVLGILIGLLLTLTPHLQAQGNTGLGTWKLNLAKSSYDPGPPLKSDDRVYEVWEGDGVKATFNQVQADGSHTTIAYSAHYDGKDYKYTGSPVFDAISIKRVDAYTTEATLKKGGKAVQTVNTVISRDGKVRTQTTVGGISSNGQKVNKNVVVWDKQ